MLDGRAGSEPSEVRRYAVGCPGGCGAAAMAMILHPHPHLLPARLSRLTGVLALALTLPGIIAVGDARAAAPVSAPYAPGVVIVGLTSATGGRTIAATLRHAGMARTSTPASGVRAIRLRRGVSVASALSRLRGRAGVSWAVPDYIAHEATVTSPALPAAFSSDLALSDSLAAPLVPDDPGRTGVAGGWQQLQWNFTGPYGVGATQAWGNLVAAGHPGGRGVLVAVLDTGVAYADHGRFRRSPDFTRYDFVQGYDFIAHTALPEDRNGHGTQVAGTIVEATNNGVGVTGLAYGVQVIPERVLDSQGNGDAMTIADGIYYAVHHHAAIINLSLEFTAGTVNAHAIPELINAIEFARARNVLVVAAAGNEGADQISYPAKAPGVVAVGATTADGCLGYYSNYGSGLTLVAPGGNADASVPGDPHCDPNAAPGPNVFQETFRRLEDPNVRRFGLPDGYYGTSMAVPEVSATAALVIASGVLGAHPSTTALIERLKATARRLWTNPAASDRYGAGLLDAAAATTPTSAAGASGPVGSASGASGHQRA